MIVLRSATGADKGVGRGVRRDPQTPHVVPALTYKPLRFTA
jgi:hypothetical protein